MSDILLHNPTTGEGLRVSSLGGYDMSVWNEVVGVTIPNDIDTRPYTVGATGFVEGYVTIPQAAYIALFTVWEQAMACTSTDPAMKVTLMRLAAAPTITLDHPDVLNGLALMVSLSILTEARVARIRSNLPPL